MSRVGSPAPVALEATGRPAETTRQPRTLELLAVAALLAAAVAVRRPGLLLSHPFWADEGWVADSVRAPLEQLPLLTSSSPLGWTLLLRVVPPLGGPQYLRLVPLAFAVAAVLPACALGRQLGRSFGRAVPLYALAAGTAVALLPDELARPALKQYPAEACVALVLVLAAARLEAAWSRAGLAVLAGACILAFPFANTAPFVTAGLLAGLAVATAARRAWRRLAELAAAAMVVAVAQAAFYVKVAALGDTPAMREYWVRHYVPAGEGLGAATAFVTDRFREVLGGLGLGPWPVAAALLALGLAALHRAGLGGVALALPLIAAELVAAAALHRYPLLDRRTSLFALALWTAVAALGLAWFAAELARWRPLGVLAVAAAAAFLVPAAWRALATPLAPEDVRGVVEHILARREPGDAVVVSSADAYSFAWYWPDQPTFVPTRAPTAVRFQVSYPPAGPVVARWLGPASIEEALDRVEPGARRIWLVADHVTPEERASWQARLAGRGAATGRPLNGLVVARFRADSP